MATYNSILKIISFHVVNGTCVYIVYMLVSHMNLLIVLDWVQMPSVLFVCIYLSVYVMYVYMYSTSQMFGHTYSFKGFSLFNYFLHCRIVAKTSEL
jgi:hypothetical protein